MFTVDSTGTRRQSDATQLRFRVSTATFSLYWDSFRISIFWDRALIYFMILCISLTVNTFFHLLILHRLLFYFVYPFKVHLLQLNHFLLYLSPLKLVCPFPFLLTLNWNSHNHVISKTFHQWLKLRFINVPKITE